MAKHNWTTGHSTETGEWTPWYDWKGVREKAMCDDTWYHYLTSHLNEPNPDENHIHYKRKIWDGRGSYVLCSIKVAGMREVNRRELIENINRVTGLNLKYR